MVSCPNCGAAVPVKRSGPPRKLTDEQVDEIIAAGRWRRDAWLVADRYQVSRSTLQRAVKRRVSELGRSSTKR